MSLGTDLNQMPTSYLEEDFMKNISKPDQVKSNSERYFAQDET
jgi:hypothetical protein